MEVAQSVTEALMIIWIMFFGGVAMCRFVGRIKRMQRCDIHNRCKVHVMVKKR